MMNETGRYPGQAWLWLYTMWYQIPPDSGSSNADIMVVRTMVGLSLLLIWRQHYAEMSGPRDAVIVAKSARRSRQRLAG